MTGRVVRAPDVRCPACGRDAGLDCTDERGAVRMAGPHPERVRLETGQRREAGAA